VGEGIRGEDGVRNACEEIEKKLETKTGDSH